MMESLKEKTARGLFWGAVGSGLTQLLNVVIGILLGRMLSPAEYGVVGILSVFTAIAGALQAGGFTQGLINLKSPTDRDYNAVFWFNVSVSLVLYAVLFVVAPLIATFFRQPCLIEVSRVVFLCLPISALGIVYNAYMQKNMMNRELALTNLLALSVSGLTGVLLALGGYSYWSLVWQQIVYIVVTNVVRLYYVRWRPSMVIDFGPVRQMFGFCVKLMVTNIINALNLHLLTFIFGRLFTIGAVGNYSQASKWSAMAGSLISGMVGQVAQPVLVSVSEERDREVRVFRKMLRFVAFLSFPAMFGLALIAREFILLTVGSQWSDCIPLLQVLCLAGAFQPFYTLYQHLAISCGKSDVYMWLNVTYIVAQLIQISLLYDRGILAVVSACSVCSVVWLLLWQVVAHRLIGLRLRDVLSDLMPFMAVAFAVMAVTFFLTSTLTGYIPTLLSRVCLAVVLYFGAMRLLRAKVMDECLRFIFHRS